MSDPTLTGPPEPDHPTITVAGDGASTPADAPAPPPGYELRALVGSGGMGSVYRARHLALQRDVAIKFLRSHYAPDSVTAWRFVEEARITARLQHPGIPPVHEVGTLPDGRPYLAMKLIRGHTLENLLKARGAPADERGRFVGIFEQVAQAVAFAHSRRIIHRDLKPANVMVGDYGEVQVMDWGLAKELAEGPPAPPSQSDETLSAELRLARAGGDVTQAGSLLGTPAFMPPEQAIGAVDLVTERADVFGLGAILCVVLTGLPPFVAENAESTRQIAARGKLDAAFARLEACGAEPELVALCKRCLSPDAADRPADAGAVAQAVAALREDAERRARQAEMDRATALVKAAEERKRRRVQRALAGAVLGLWAVAAAAAWVVDRERSRHRADQQADELRHEIAQKEREAEIQARRLTTERDVSAALNESQVLREEGWKQTEDPQRWALTLVAARSALKRADGLLAAGEPTNETLARVAAAAAELDRDDADRALLAELDRIGEENDIRFLMAAMIGRGPSNRYAAAFRARGVDLATAPRAEAVAWLKGHRFRDRLTAAVRNWQFSLPLLGRGDDLDRMSFAHALSAVGGAVGGTALSPLSLRDRLAAVLDAVTEEPFAREWWTALARHDSAAIKRLIRRPELERMSSRELSSLADGLVNLRNDHQEIVSDFLRIAYNRFPGEFWVNFRLAVIAMLKPKDQKADTLRHLNAAVAARPQSAIARTSLGIELWQMHEDDPTGPRIIRGAADIDPTSPWPHLALAEIAMHEQNAPDALRALERAVRADPDTGFFFVHVVFFMMSEVTGRFQFPEDALGPFIDGLVASHPDHPGGYEVRAEFLLRGDNVRAALADFRRAKAHMRPDYPQRVLLGAEFETIEALGRWEEKLPAVLRSEVHPASATEFAELAGYCAKFEKKYALAARFAAAAVAADREFDQNWAQMNQFAAWALRAAYGKGTDAADLAPGERARLRRQALSWLRAALARTRKELAPVLAPQVFANPSFAPVRDTKELAKLPPEERAEWEKFWTELPLPAPGPPNPPREIAPAPRPIE